MEPTEPRRSLLDRALRLFGEVRAGEAGTVLLMLLNVFAILTGYYVAKTVREPLILAGGGAEVKSYAAAGQALALMVFIPLYGWFASRVDRARLVYGVTLFFILNLELFWLGAKAGIPYLGVAFFIWVGIFNNAIIAQFWSYGNDIYRQESGERLFPVIAIGATLGSWLGSKFAEQLFRAGVPAYSMLHITAGLLVASLVFYHLVENREGRRRVGSAPRLEKGPNGFELLVRNPYLRLIAVLLLILNLVNTTGEYILGRAVVEAAAADGVADKEAFIGAFYGNYFSWVNILAALLQALVASRLVRLFGIAGVVLALPFVSLGAYSAVLAGATLGVIRWAKITENATDYSIMNTARHMLWLPTRREEKYKAKQASDTFVVRAGDVFSAALVYAGTHWLGLGGHGFAVANLLVVSLWLFVGFLLVREYRRLSRTAPAA